MCLSRDTQKAPAASKAGQGPMRRESPGGRMKYTTYVLLAAGMLMASYQVALANPESGGDKSDHRGAFAEKMKERLGLTDEQAVKVKSEWEAEKTAFKTLHQQQREATQKLEDQVRSLASEKDIQATLDQLDAGRKAMAAEMQKHESSLASVLKPSQRAKMRLFMRQEMGRRFHGKHGADRHEGRDKHHDDHDEDGQKDD